MFFIALQDFKERKVYWFLFPILGIALGLLHFLETGSNQLFLYHVLFNGLLVTLLLLLLFFLTKTIFKKPFLNHSFGLGDLLFFYAFGLGFPPVTFIILFTNSLFFSLLVFVLFKKYHKATTVPLAGLMAVFVFLVLTIDTFVTQPSLYSY